VIKVVHAQVGGVTDATCRFFVIRRVAQSTEEDIVLTVEERPSRDARSILKMARPGIKSTRPEQIPFEAATKAEYVSPGVMSCAGISQVRPTSSDKVRRNDVDQTGVRIHRVADGW
jgi:hypothetical protein